MLRSNGVPFHSHRATILLLSLAVITLLSVPAAFADQSIVRKQNVQIMAGDTLVIHSNHNTISKMFTWTSNMTLNVTMIPQELPANETDIVAPSPGTYEANVLFNYTDSYLVTVFVYNSSASAFTNGSYTTPGYIGHQLAYPPATNATSYSISAGSLELDLSVTVNPHSTTPAMTSTGQPETPWEALLTWVGTFGKAFPLWVKFVYLIFGIQFFAVGGIWIRREGEKRSTTPQRLDTGNVIYLVSDILLKFLAVSCVTIVALMLGELLIPPVLQFMFLININLLSLWDVFVLGFAAGMVIIAYLTRFILGSLFDLKPMEFE